MMSAMTETSGIVSCVEDQCVYDFRCLSAECDDENITRPMH